MAVGAPPSPNLAFIFAAAISDVSSLSQSEIHVLVINNIKISDPLLFRKHFEKQKKNYGSQISFNRRHVPIEKKMEDTTKAKIITEFLIEHTDDRKYLFFCSHTHTQTARKRKEEHDGHLTTHLSLSVDVFLN